MSTTAELAKHEPAKPALAIEGGLIQCTSIESAYRFGQYIVKSGLAPKCFTTPEAVLVAVQMGAELGMKPMQSLQSIAVINGKPALWGKGLAGLVLASGQMENLKEWFEGEGDSMVACCEVKRKGIAEARLCKFSMADAKKAGLAGKGTWAGYPRDMAMYKARARAFTLFADVLCGMAVVEDMTEVVRASQKPDAPTTPIDDPLLKQVGATVVTAEVGEDLSFPDDLIPAREMGDETL